MIRLWKVLHMALSSKFDYPLSKLSLEIILNLLCHTRQPFFESTFTAEFLFECSWLESGDFDDRVEKDHRNLLSQSLNTLWNIGSWVPNGSQVGKGYTFYQGSKSGSENREKGRDRGRERQGRGERIVLWISHFVEMWTEKVEISWINPRKNLAEQGPST